MRFRIWISPTLTGVMLMVLSVSMRAHHSLPAYYDFDKTASIKGVLKEARIINPHSSFVFEVTEANGQKVLWNVIAGSGTQMAKAGWTKDTIKVGEVITIDGHPGKNGAKGLVGLTFTTADGKQIKPGNLD